MNVVTAGPMPPEVAAYALARYSRSSDNLKTSLAWVKDRDSGDFLEQYYFKFGHPSIADLGHIVMSLEGISEIAAVEVEDEPLWDGMARSTRYQDFSKVEPVVPPELDSQQRTAYEETFAGLLKAYQDVQLAVLGQLYEENPKPAEMSPEQYTRAIHARAFDNARYLLPMGIPTSVGQVTSIRTLEKQIRRLMASKYTECRELGMKMRDACRELPSASFQRNGNADESAVAPTLAKYLEPSEFLAKRDRSLWDWYENTVKNRWGLRFVETEVCNNVRLFQTGHLMFMGSSKVSSPTSEILAALLYRNCDASYEEVMSFVFSLSCEDVKNALAAALKHRGPHDELPREFRNEPYTFEITMDLGAYRDLHRHRRCQQFRQPYGTRHGYEIPETVIRAGAADIYKAAADRAHKTFDLLWPCPGADSILPLATRIRTLFRMDFAETDYICRLRSKVGGHISYRKLAWEMAQLMKQTEPLLGRLIEATSPEVEAPLCR